MYLPVSYRPDFTGDAIVRAPRTVRRAGQARKGHRHTAFHLTAHRADLPDPRHTELAFSSRVQPVQEAARHTPTPGTRLCPPATATSTPLSSSSPEERCSVVSITQSAKRLLSLRR